jgi:hypothetical protein
MRSQEPHLLSEFHVDGDWYPEMVNKWVMKPVPTVHDFPGRIRI